MDTLQGDIDALEREKTELRERVKELSRKTLMEGIVRQSSAGMTAAVVVTIIGVIICIIGLHHMHSCSCDRCGLLLRILHVE